MRKLLLAVLFLGLALLFRPATNAAETVERQREFEELYSRWHRGLDTNMNSLSQPFFFRTNAGPPELVAVVQEMMRHGLAMTPFLCEKLAREKLTDRRLYSDVLLLEKMTGIDLFHADDASAANQDFGANIVKFTGQFQAEWRRGIYKDPRARIAPLCEARLAKEGGATIDARDVVALRRYGIFGLPELVRQIRKSNSRHAFAAYLIITGQPDEYGDYILQADKKLTTREEKLADIEKRVANMKNNGGEGLQVIKDVEAALAEK